MVARHGFRHTRARAETGAGTRSHPSAGRAPKPAVEHGTGRRLRLRAATVLPVMVATIACTTGVDLGGGVTRYGDSVAVYSGPELEVALGYSRAARDLGDPWLLLALELTAAPGAGVVTVSRSDIRVVTPDGRRLGLVDQGNFRASYGEFRVRLDRALAILPVLARYDTSRIPCDRWFLADPFAGFAYDQVYVNTFQVCSGPLVFRDPRGVQPGRWRLLIELEESTVDLPFELEPPD